MKLKIGARRHEANEWLTSSKIPQFQCQVFSAADAHIAYWCHNSKSSECRDLHTGLSPMSSASSPDRGRCVPNTSQTVRSLWKRAFPSWNVRFAYTAWSERLLVKPQRPHTDLCAEPAGVWNRLQGGRNRAPTTTSLFHTPTGSAHRSVPQGLYTASLVSLKDALIGWSASDYDAPI